MIREQGQSFQNVSKSMDIGQTAIRRSPAGRDRDDETGEMIYYCDFETNGTG